MINNVCAIKRMVVAEIPRAAALWNKRVWPLNCLKTLHRNLPSVSSLESIIQFCSWVRHSVFGSWKPRNKIKSKDF